MTAANQKNILILQHELSTPPGSLLTWLEQANFSYRIFYLPSARSFSPQNWQELESFDGLVILGGSMNVDQEELFPWLRPEKKLIKKYIDSQKPTLGLCLGGQLIAEVLGGRVEKAPHWEAGFQKVVLNDNQPLAVFQWHGYQFTPPPGALSWGASSACAHQAFSYHDHVIGLQFHPESTIEFIQDCAINTIDSEYPVGDFVQSRDEILKSCVNLQKPLQDWFFSLLEQHFCIH